MIKWLIQYGNQKGLDTLKMPMAPKLAEHFLRVAWYQ